jgi:hypothetical protein
MLKKKKKNTTRATEGKSIMVSAVCGYHADEPLLRIVAVMVNVIRPRSPTYRAAAQDEMCGKIPPRMLLMPSGAILHLLPHPSPSIEALSLFS